MCLFLSWLIVFGTPDLYLFLIVSWKIRFGSFGFVLLLFEGPFCFLFCLTISWMLVVGAPGLLIFIFLQ